MKSPKYIKLSPIKQNEAKELYVTATVVWWGWFIIIWQSVKNQIDIEWYDWPKVIFLMLKTWVKILSKGVDSYG
jgi:hypothetical protein